MDSRSEQASAASQLVASFAEEPDGELLRTGFRGREEQIYRLVPVVDGGK